MLWNRDVTSFAASSSTGEARILRRSSPFAYPGRNLSMSMITVMIGPGCSLSLDSECFCDLRSALLSPLSLPPLADSGLTVGSSGDVPDSTKPNDISSST